MHPQFFSSTFGTIGESVKLIINALVVRIRLDNGSDTAGERTTLNFVSLLFTKLMSSALS